MGRRFVHLVAIAAALAVSAMGSHWVWSFLSRPITTVRVEGELTTSERALVRKAVDELLTERRDASSSDVVERVSRYGWLRSVRARRVWPDVVDVSVERETLAARWGSDAFLTSGGAVVRVPDVGAGFLPALTASTTDSVTTMNLYRTLNETSEQSGLQLTSLMETGLGQWRATFANDITVDLGATEVVARLDRFLAVYAQVIKGKEQIVQRVDARYDNGVAVQWSPDDETLAPPDHVVGSRPAWRGRAGMPAAVLAAAER